MSSNYIIFKPCSGVLLFSSPNFSPDYVQGAVLPYQPVGLPAAPCASGATGGVGGTAGPHRVPGDGGTELRSQSRLGPARSERTAILGGLQRGSGGAVERLVHNKEVKEKVFSEIVWGPRGSFLNLSVPG